MNGAGYRNLPIDPRLIQLGEVFTPAVPVQDADLFSGRRDLLLRIARAIGQRGMHCILFGERGVGKTSLANILPVTLDAAGRSPVTAAVTCDTTDDYTSLMRKLLQEMVTVRRIRNIGFRECPSTEQNPLSQNLPEKPRPNDVRLLMEAAGTNTLLILDEFDRINDQDSIRLVSDTIKTLSDRAVPTTLVLVGAADNVDSLLREHRSIERCLTEVRMPRMTTEELAEIIEKGLQQVDMTMDNSVQWYIPTVAQGYPHYAHLLALEAAGHTVTGKRSTVNRDDIESSINNAIAHSDHSIQSKYGRAVHSANPTALYEPVLLACALADTDDLNFFNAQAIRQPLSEILGRSLDIPAFARHLDVFCQEERGPALIKEGQARRYRYRFALPMLRPYVLLRGIADKHINADALRKFA